MTLLLSSQLVGRAHELGRLTAAIDTVATAAASARGVAVALLGEAGMGKSTLRRHAERYARTRGVKVLSGRAADGSAIALRPLAEALSSGFRREGVPRDPAVTALLPTLAHLVPHWSTRVAAETSVIAIAEAVLRLLEVAGRDGGIVLTIEDAHWADEDTLAVLEYLIDHRAAHGALVLLTLRPQPSPASRLVRKLTDSRALSILDLPPLPATDMDTMVLDCLGEEAAAEDILTFVREHADGVPFLAEELLAGLVRSGALIAGADGWAVTGPLLASVPATFAESVSVRLRGLAPEHRRVLLAAALLGREFDWQILPAMIDQPRQAVLDALEAAGAVQLLDTDEAVLRFRHALTRESVLATMLGPQRAELASRALRVAGDEDPLRTAELAIICGQTDRAAKSLLLAADQARVRGALASAAAQLRRALGLARDPEVVLEITQRLAEVHAVSGEVDQAVTLAEHAMAVRRERGDATRCLAGLELVLGRAMLVAGALDRATRHAEVALAGISPVPTEPHERRTRAQALVLIAQVAVTSGKLTQAQRLAGEALSLVTPTPDGTDPMVGLADVRCEALEVIGRCQRTRDVTAAEWTFAEALAQAERADLGLWRARALHELGTIDLLDRMSTDRLVAARRSAIEAGSPALAAVVDFHTASALIARNSIADGRAVVRRAVDVAARLRLPILPYALTMLARSHAHERDLPAVTETIARIHEVAPDDQAVAAAVHSHVHAMFALHEADRDGLARSLDRSADLLRANPGQHDPHRGLWALLRTLDGDGVAQRAEVAGGNGADTRFNRAMLTAAEAVVAGRRGESSRAEAKLASALAQVRGYQGGEWLAQVALWLVAPEAHRAGWGDPAGDLTNAVRWFAGHGYEPLVAACRRELRAIGAPVPRAGRGESAVPAALVTSGVTSREMDVLRLVVAGLTNREIAAKLVLSPKTVEKHVASLLLKTGQADRRGLGAAFAGDLDHAA